MIEGAHHMSEIPEGEILPVFFFGKLQALQEVQRYKWDSLHQSGHGFHMKTLCCFVAANFSSRTWFANVRLKMCQKRHEMIVHNHNGISLDFIRLI